jgi:hypothetical protein
MRPPARLVSTRRADDDLVWLTLSSLVPDTRKRAPLTSWREVATRWRSLWRDISRLRWLPGNCQDWSILLRRLRVPSSEFAYLGQPQNCGERGVRVLGMRSLTVADV